MATNAVDPTVEAEVKIRRLTAVGKLEQAESLYRAKSPGLPGPGQVAAVAAVAEGYEQVGRLAEAQRIIDEFGEPNAVTTELPPEIDIGFHNTRGNVFRRNGRVREALIEYAVAAKRLPEARDQQRWSFTVFANWAYGLQQVEAHRAALQVLAPLLFLDLPPAREADVLTLMANSLGELGQYETALEQAENALARLGDPDDAVEDVRARVLASLTTAAARVGDSIRTLAAAQELADLARNRGDQWQVASALATAANAARVAGNGAAPRLTAEAQAALADARANSDITVNDAEATDIKARILEDLGDVSGLERLLADTTSPSFSVLTSMIGLRARRGELERAKRELHAAWTLLLGRVFGGELDLADVERLRSVSQLRGWTAERAFQAYDREGGHGLELLAAAELAASLVAGYLTWPSGARVDPARLLDPRWLLAEAADAAIVFAVQGERNVRIVLLRGSDEEVVLEWDGFELDAIRDEVAAITRRSRPEGDPLAVSDRWNAFACALGAALSDRLVLGEHVLFVLGYVLDGLPLHVVETGEGPLCQRFSCSYAASLFQLAGVRRRRPRHDPPQTAGVVSVWRVRDTARTAAAFRTAGIAFAELLQSHGVDVETLVGRDGSVDVVRDLLGRVDLLYLSCHGVGGSDGRHAFLLAGAGQLPPMLVRPRRAPGGPDFLLDWHELGEPTAPIVVSAACSSSSGSMSFGGERVSLDRTLLASGTRTFIGPLWDVDVEAATGFCLDVATRYLKGGRTWADSWRLAIEDARKTSAPASWQSFILVGDWR